MPRRIAYLLYNTAWMWKKECGAPPVPGVRLVTVKTNPFRILSSQIKGGQVPSYVRPEIRHRHVLHPRVCTAWVEFRVTRPFQGWVVARFYEKFRCRKSRRRRRPVCARRLYPQDDRRYLHLTPTGTKLTMSFYVSTPPAVCRKPGLGATVHPRGCYCQGLDRARITLGFQDDPFLFEDRLIRPRRR